MKAALYVLVAEAFWMFMFWLSGADLPSERGEHAVFFALGILLIGVCGFIAYKLQIEMSAK